MAIARNAERYSFAPVVDETKADDATRLRDIAAELDARGILSRRKRSLAHLRIRERNRIGMMEGACASSG